VPRRTQGDQLQGLADRILKNFPKTPKLSQHQTLFFCWKCRTICEALRDATQHEGKILWSCADEDLNKGGIRLHKIGVHGHPGEPRNGLYECHVCAIKARDNMHESMKPLTKLGDWRGIIKSRFLNIKLVNEYVIRLVIPLHTHTTCAQS
jgi:hypothetical protein